MNRRPTRGILVLVDVQFLLAALVPLDLGRVYDRVVGRDAPACACAAHAEAAVRECESAVRESESAGERVGRMGSQRSVSASGFHLREGGQEGRREGDTRTWRSPEEAEGRKRNGHSCSDQRWMPSWKCCM